MRLRTGLPLFCVGFLLPLTSTLHAQLQHRQAAVTVAVKNPAGVALPGATVRVEMINPAFRFGTSMEQREITPGGNGYTAAGVAAIQEYFNSVTYGNELKWSYFEGRSVPATLALINQAFALRAFNSDQPMGQRGHATIWGASYQLPVDFRAMTDPATMRTRLVNHVSAYHTALRDSGIINWDLYNEHLHERSLIIEKLVPGSTRDTMVEQQAAEAAEWFKAAQAADPKAKLFINEYNILNFWQENDSQVIAYKRFIDAVRDAGGPVGGIGLQAHMDRMITKAQITRRLNLLSAPMAPTANHPNGLPGLPIEITELDINTQQWSTATPTDQATVTANVLEGAFEHPSVEGITIWGIRDSLHWRNNAILFDDSNPNAWVIKPSGQAWIDRVKGTWWTNLSGLTNGSGVYTGTAFKGLHRITVSYNGTTQEVVRQLSADETVAIEIDDTPVDTSGSFLTNLSVRTTLQAEQVLTLGFVVDGGAAKNVLVRAWGPALQAAPFNLGGMPDPRLGLYQDGILREENNDWPASLAGTAAAVGAYPFASGSLDAALVRAVTGPTSVLVQGNQSGIVLAEAYDTAAAAAGARFSNVSARNFSGTGSDVLTAGFVVGGSGKIRLLIRGVGPELQAQFGLTGVLADPQIRVFDSAGNVVASNNDWDAAIAGAMSGVGAFTLTPGSKDAALLVLLDAGGAGYTVQVSGADGGTGEAIVEVYEVR